MKIKYKHPSVANPLSIKINDRYMFKFSNDIIDWMVINNRPTKELYLLGRVKGKRSWWWCNAIPFKSVFGKYPRLMCEMDKFNKKGFNKKILESVLDGLNIREGLADIDVEQFNHYISIDHGAQACQQ